MKCIHFNGSEETVELILRTVHFCQSAQYLRSRSRFVQRIGSDSRKQTEGEVGGSRVVPTEIANANATSLSSTSLAQGNLLQEYEQKFAERPDDQKLSKLCSDALVS